MYYSERKVDINLTRKYLACSLLLKDSDFVKYIRQLNINSIYINDPLFTKTEVKEELPPYIYLLVDTKGENKFGHYVDMQTGVYKFYESLAFIQKDKDYVSDYPFSNKNDNFHVIVLKVDDKLFKHFIKGEYSKMYSPNEIEKCIIKNVKSNNKTVINPIYKVLHHDDSYFPSFLSKLKEEFRCKIDGIEKHIEYEFPPYHKQEYLRYG